MLDRGEFELELVGGRRRTGEGGSVSGASGLDYSRVKTKESSRSLLDIMVQLEEEDGHAGSTAVLRQALGKVRNTAWGERKEVQ